MNKEIEVIKEKLEEQLAQVQKQREELEALKTVMEERIIEATTARDNFKYLAEYLTKDK